MSDLLPGDCHTFLTKMSKDVSAGDRHAIANNIKGNFIQSYSVTKIEETIKKKEIKIINSLPLCCIYSNECLHLNDGGKDQFERFLKNDKIRYQKRRGIQKTTSACCLRKVRHTMGFSLFFRRSRPLSESKYLTVTVGLGCSSFVVF